MDRNALAVGLATLLILLMPTKTWARQCKRGKPCGKSCIAAHRICHIGGIRRRGSSTQGGEPRLSPSPSSLTQTANLRLWANRLRENARLRCRHAKLPTTRWQVATASELDALDSVQPGDRVVVAQRKVPNAKECGRIGCAASGATGRNVLILMHTKSGIRKACSLNRERDSVFDLVLDFGAAHLEAQRKAHQLLLDEMDAK